VLTIVLVLKIRRNDKSIDLLLLSDLLQVRNNGFSKSAVIV